MPPSRRVLYCIVCLAIALVADLLAGLSHPAVQAATRSDDTTQSWSPEAAARYLDQRELTWQKWDHAQREQGTFCISCHTQLAYAYGRPALRTDIHEYNLNPPEEALLTSIRKRVALWNQLPPFYSDAHAGTGKAEEARATEAVLNAIILLRYDTLHLSPDTRAALNNAWALQLKSGPDLGSWKWLNFDLAPWETPNAQYFGAAMLAQAVSTAPDDYSRHADAVGHLSALRLYLTTHYTQQPLFNQVIVLWASAHLPGLLSSQQRKQLLDAIYGHQNADGGWSLSKLGPWQRSENSPQPTASDGYATGIAVLALEANSAQNAYLRRGIQWLKTHQDPTTGAWPAQSLNQNRDPNTNVGKFMTDASTGFAALALESQP